MLADFRKFVGCKILEYFLSYPTQKKYLNELARELAVSSRSIKIYCDLLEKDGIINREITGNVHLFSTNNNHYRVQEMKRAYIANLLAEHHIETIQQTCISFAVYGSHASGLYDERSDLDLLIIGDEHQINKDNLLNLQQTLGKEIHLTILSLTQWETMKKNNDPFAKAILQKHLLLAGAQL
jgi:predicted nucleotidyltransferase